MTARCRGTPCSRPRRSTASPRWRWATAASASRRPRGRQARLADRPARRRRGHPWHGAGRRTDLGLGELPGLSRRHLARRRYAIDLGAHMPHAALRAYVMGERGADHTAAPTDARSTQMERAHLRGAGRRRASASPPRAPTSTAAATARNIGTLTASRGRAQGIAGALKRSGNGVIQLISDAYLTADDDFAAAELRLIRASGPGRRPAAVVHRAADRRGARSLARHLRRDRRDGRRRPRRPRPGRAAAGRRDARLRVDHQPVHLHPHLSRRSTPRSSARAAGAALPTPRSRAAILAEHGADRARRLRRPARPTASRACSG